MAQRKKPFLYRHKAGGVTSESEELKARMPTWGEVSMKVKVKLGRQNLVSEEQRDAEMELLVYEK